jgi:hypothetical protein
VMADPRAAVYPHRSIHPALGSSLLLYSELSSFSVFLIYLGYQITLPYSSSGQTWEVNNFFITSPFLYTNDFYQSLYLVALRHCIFNVFYKYQLIVSPDSQVLLFQFSRVLIVHFLSCCVNNLCMLLFICRPCMCYKNVIYLINQLSIL